MNAQSFSHLFFKITAKDFTLSESVSTLLILSKISESVLLPLTVISGSVFMSGGIGFFTVDCLYNFGNWASACFMAGSMRFGNSSLSSV